MNLSATQRSKAMFQITKAEHYKGTLGYLHLTRLDNDNEPLSERVMLPVMAAEDFDWASPPTMLTDEAVATLLYDFADTLEPFIEEEDEPTNLAYCKTCPHPYCEPCRQQA